MLAERPNVLLQRRIPLCIVTSVAKALICNERDLGINDNLPVLWQMNDHVRVISLAFLIDDDLLDRIFPPPHKSRLLEQVFKNQLAPATLSLCLTFERSREVLRFLPDRLF